jgi:hypothetical protein
LVKKVYGRQKESMSINNNKFAKRKNGKPFNLAINQVEKTI